MHLHFCIFAAFSLATCVLAGSLPSFIKPCSISDPNLNHCIEKAIEVVGPRFADGIPELGIAPLDPVDLGKVVVDSPALKLTFTDTVVTGLRDFKINSYKLDLEKQNAELDFTANVTLKGNYEMDGQILILPIKGNGQAKIKITNLNIVLKYDFETKDGHWLLKRYTDTYKMDRAHFKFTNLFGGKNKELSDTTHKFLDENWNTVMQEIAPPAIEYVIKKCVTVVKKFFTVLPISEYMILDTVGKCSSTLPNTIGNVINNNWEPVIRDIAPIAFENIIAACVNEAKKLFGAVPVNQLLLP